MLAPVSKGSEVVSYPKKLQSIKRSPSKSKSVKKGCTNCKNRRARMNLSAKYNLCLICHNLSHWGQRIVV